MRIERDVKAEILEAFGCRQDLMLWNHPTGMARSLGEGGRMIRFGLVGSADLLGLRAVVITPAMVGKTIGQALAIETKRPKGGRQGEQQSKFQVAWERRGGLYLLARSVEAVHRGLG